MKFEVAWQEIKRGRIHTMFKAFKTIEKLEAFVTKIEKKPSFHQLMGYDF